MSDKMVIFVVLLCLVLPFCYFPACDSKSFTIDYDHDCFLKDGEPFRYISGGMHYFRVPRYYWRDRLIKMKAAGLNTVQTYVAWNVHEPVEGQYNFQGDADLVSFIELADSLGLLVIVRAGPYICAEWDFGGFPGWLLKNTSIVLRSSQDQQYISAVKSWMSVLLPKLKPLLYANEGPIISVQVENEYGSWPACDHGYMMYLQQLFRQYLGDDVVLFTVDGDQESFMKCGTISSLYATVDFGITDDPDKAFAVMRKFQPKGPLVNTEFYTGWLDHWGEPHQMRSPNLVAKALDKILFMNASLNFYMFEGGTNFGFMNGATIEKTGYVPVTTSYDYDAPLSEAGDPTEKYFLLREVIARYQIIPPMPIPPATPKFAYGQVHMSRLSSLLDAIPMLTPLGPTKSLLPMTMEQLGQNYGFVFYRTQIPDAFRHSVLELNIPELVRDRAMVYVGKVQQGVLNRTREESKIQLVIGEFLQLDILVENMGRVCYGNLQDPKGIIGNVTLNNTLLYNWEMYTINLTNLDSIVKSPVVSRENLNGVDVAWDGFAPTFFQGEIPASSYGSSYDTYLQLNGWSKGQAFVNGVNIGRYWPAAGPQKNLYVPASVLTPDAPSKLVLLELDFSPCAYPETCFVQFVTTPAINGTVNPIMKAGFKKKGNH